VHSVHRVMKAFCICAIVVRVHSVHRVMKAFCIYCLLVSTVGRSGHAASGHANSRACSLVSKKNLVCGGSGAASRSTKLCARGSIPWWLIWKERNARVFDVRRDAAGATAPNHP
jgi:hypothetical protein